MGLSLPLLALAFAARLATYGPAPAPFAPTVDPLVGRAQLLEAARYELDYLEYQLYYGKDDADQTAEKAQRLLDAVQASATNGGQPIEADSERRAGAQVDNALDAIKNKDSPRAVVYVELARAHLAAAENLLSLQLSRRPPGGEVPQVPGYVPSVPPDIAQPAYPRLYE